MSQLICLSDRCTQHRLISDFTDIMTHVEDRHQLMKFDYFKEEWYQIQEQVKEFSNIKEGLRESIVAKKKQLDEIVHQFDERFQQIDNLSSNLDIDKFEIQQAMLLYKQFQYLKQEKQDINDLIRLDLETCFVKFSTFQIQLLNKLDKISSIVAVIENQKYINKPQNRQVAQIQSCDYSMQYDRTSSDFQAKIDQQQQKIQILSPPQSCINEINEDDNIQFWQKEFSNPSQASLDEHQIYKGTENNNNLSLLNLNLFAQASELISQKLFDEPPQFNASTHSIGQLYPLQMIQDNNQVVLQQQILFPQDQDDKMEFDFESWLNEKQEPIAQASLQNQQENHHRIEQQEQFNQNPVDYQFGSYDQESINQSQLSASSIECWYMPKISQTKIISSEQSVQQPQPQLIRQLTGARRVIKEENQPTYNGCQNNQRVENRICNQLQQRQQSISNTNTKNRQKQQIRKQVKFDKQLSERDIAYEYHAQQANLKGKKYLICDQSFMISGASQLQLLITPKQERTKIMIGIVCLERWKEGSIEKYLRTGETVSNKGNTYLSLIKWRIRQEGLLKVIFQNKVITINSDQSYDLGHKGFSEKDKVSFFIESQQCILKIQ